MKQALYLGRVASTENIKSIQKMMEGVIKEGTGSRLVGYEIPYNLIGKTGTTQNNGGWLVYSLFSRTCCWFMGRYL